MALQTREEHPENTLPQQEYPRPLQPEDYKIRGKVAEVISLGGMKLLEPPLIAVFSRKKKRLHARGVPRVLDGTGRSVTEALPNLFQNIVSTWRKLRSIRTFEDQFEEKQRVLGPLLQVIDGADLRANEPVSILQMGEILEIGDTIKISWGSWEEEIPISIASPLLRAGFQVGKNFECECAYVGNACIGMGNVKPHTPHEFSTQELDAFWNELEKKAGEQQGS